jgi:hypothetical protein
MFAKLTQAQASRSHDPDHDLALIRATISAQHSILLNSHTWALRADNYEPRGSAINHIPRDPGGHTSSPLLQTVNRPFPFVLHTSSH